MTKSIKIVLVDDHTLFRKGMVALLQSVEDMFVVADAPDVPAAMRVCELHQPDVILLDINMPGIDGIQAISELKKKAPGAVVLMLTVSEDPEDLSQALAHGATGYLLKTTDKEPLLQSIRLAQQGVASISPELTHTLVTLCKDSHKKNEMIGSEHPLQVLSPREQEVAWLVADGASNKEIARQLQIAETTVKLHVGHIMKKLGFQTRVQVAVFISNIT